MNVASSCSETPLRPTEAMLRFAQFRMRNNSKRRSEAKLTDDGEEDRIERLLRHRTSIQDVIGAESDDGNSTSEGEEDGAGKENETRAPPRDRPAVSKGRRALLRVSQRALAKRRQKIKQQGFQHPCCSPVSQEEEEEMVLIFHQRSSDERTCASLNKIKNKVNSRRISVGSIRKKKRQRYTSIRNSDPERSRRFNAAFQAALTSSLSERKGEVASVQRTTVQKRWTRPSLGATDALNFIEWIDSNNTRKRAVHNPTSPSKAPLDRGASWLVHLPRKQADMSPKRTPSRHTTADVVARSGRSYQSLTPERSRQVASVAQRIFSGENETVPANTTSRDRLEHSMESGVASFVDQFEQHLMATNAVAAKSPDRLPHGWNRTYVGTRKEANETICIPPTVTYDSDEDSMCSSEDDDPFSSVLLDSSFVHPNRPTDESLSSQGLLLKHQTGSPLDISSSSTDVVIGDASGVVDCKMNNITALGRGRLSAAFRVSLEGESRGPTLLGAMEGQQQQTSLAACRSERSNAAHGVSVDGESNIRVTTTETFCTADDRENVMRLMDPNVSGDVKPKTTTQDHNTDVYASIAKIVEETLSLVDNGKCTYDKAPTGTISDDADGLSVIVETTNNGAAVASPRDDRVSPIKEQTGPNSSIASWSSWSGEQALTGDGIRPSGIESLSLIANEQSVETPGTSDTNRSYLASTARSPESICSSAGDVSVCSVDGQDTASNDNEETDSPFSDNDFLPFNVQDLSGLIVDDVLQSLAAWSVDDSTLEGNFGSNSARSTSHKVDLLSRSPKLSVHGDVGDREKVKESDSIAPEEITDSEVTPQDPVAPPPHTMYFADWSISKASTISFFKKLGVGSGYTSSGPSKERQATRRPAPKQRNRNSRSYISANNTAGCGLSTERANSLQAPLMKSHSDGGAAVDFDIRWEKRLMM